MKDAIEKTAALKNRPSGGILSFWASHERVINILVLVLAVALPLIINDRYFTTIAINCALYSVLALSLNLITGYMGVTSLGHAAFYGIGAYTAAILATRLNLNFFFTFMLSAVMAGLFGFLLGLPTLRIKGRYFAIVTLGFCEITRIVELNWMSLTRGPMGIPFIPSFIIFGKRYSAPIYKYFVILGLLLVTIYIVSAIINSRTGRAVRAIKDDELASEVNGINVFRYRLVIFSISSAIAGVAGAFYAHHMSFIDPKAFTFDQSILMLSMIILGGMGSIQGSIMGAIALAAAPELLRGLIEYRQIIYGALIVFMVITRPSGLLGGINLAHVRQRKSLSKLGKENG
ncbi:MAG: High-affinity branched-chain amino acid transport system permease protein LivH [Firmicutes bacterium ADurb.Bin153]|nr:MAG: High-affinity branched-chain amino acid transport system permease protein LivH [Firmicutes bacterium ADurb.Bin153]